MPGVAVSGQMEPHHTFLSDGDLKDNALEAEPVRTARTTFVDGESRGDRVPMVRHHPLRALFPADFLLGIDHHFETASQRQVLSLECQHRHQRHYSMRLVVDRAARPYKARRRDRLKTADG